VSYAEAKGMPKYEGGGSEQESEEIKKTRAWKDKLAEIERTKDALGFPVDEHIRETIVALNLSGFPTSASCEGHIDRARGAPWVRIEAPGRPEERFIHENAIIDEVARKYGISADEVRDDINHEAWKEASSGAAENDETREYAKWRKKNEVLRERLSKLLDEFYASRSVAPPLRLELSTRAGGIFMLKNGGEDYTTDVRALSNEERSELGRRLAEYQNEMRSFTAFLREKYYGKQSID
jgi:hypothetical protein